MASIREQYLLILQSDCEVFNIDSKIMDAIFQVESSWEAWAVRYEKNYPYLANPTKYAKSNRITVDTETMLQKMSWGLGQVMGGTARYLGFEGPLQSLCNPELGIHFSCLYFSKFCNKYEKLEDKIASYNAGSAIYDNLGVLKNKSYVDKVLKVLAGNSGTKT